MASNISGPQIPSHLLSKRKRVEQGGEEGGEVAVQAQAVQASRSSTGRAEETTKKKRVAGPAPPPAALEERPPGSPDGGSESGGSSSTSSTSDDEFGPALPSASRTEEEEEFEARLRLARYETMRTLGAADANDGKPKRDEWMIVPPKSEDWTAKVDPTKIKNRKFQTGRGAKAPPQRPGGENTLWTETPEQRRQRLEDEVMGRKKPATQGPAPSSDSVGSAEARETARRIEEYNMQHRSKSLYEEHKGKARLEEDDPSKRAFDREKDIAGGRKINHQQKKEMLNRAADFSSRFSSGKYL